MLNIETIPLLFFAFAEPRIVLLIGILFQVMACLIAFAGNKNPEKVQKKSFSFRMNKVSICRLLLLFGMACVSVVTLFESDYILFTGQCLLFALLYPRK